jgi:tetratricopeptide (TPR) repeat protein
MGGRDVDAPEGGWPSVRAPTTIIAPQSETTGRRRLAVGSTPPPFGNEPAREAERFLAAQALIERGHWIEARAALHALALDNPRDSRYRVHLHYAWAREHAADGRREAARAELRRSLTLDPSFEPSARFLAALRPRPRLLRWLWPDSDLPE